LQLQFPDILHSMLSIFLFLDSLGGGELLMIMLFILLFFGSGKIPDLAKGLGRGMREFKDAMNGVQRDIEQSMKEKEYKRETEKNTELPAEKKADNEDMGKPGE
jgi:sec-independent protein translocase protein TatA